MASPVRKPTKEGLGFSGLVHEEAHPCFWYFVQTPLKCVDAGSIDRLLIQLISFINYSIGEKYLQQFLVQRNLASF